MCFWILFVRWDFCKCHGHRKSSKKLFFYWVCRIKWLVSWLWLRNLPFVGDGLGISSKLDFGESQSPKLVGTSTQYRSISVPYRAQKKEEPKSDDFEDIGVVCVSGEGCNATTKINKSEDSIQTDVVVHVKTNVNVNQRNKTNFVDDTPDVPIVVGTDSGADNSRVPQTRPLVVTSLDDSILSDGLSLSSPTSSINSRPAFDTQALHSKNVYLENSDLPTGDLRVNIKTLTPVTLADDGRSLTNAWQRTNGIELSVPRFEQSYHSHYFGENPPPQLVWYPKRSGLSSFDYKSKGVSKPAFFSVGALTTPSHKHQGSGSTCSCKNEASRGLQWYPARRTYTDAGSQINDKLAPLNWTRNIFCTVFLDK